MFQGAYRVQRRFVRFCASAHRNRSRLPASVRRRDCAEMHMIPIADQLAESRPIAYQDVTHVNIIRSARPPARPPARRDAARSARQRRCPVSQPAKSFSVERYAPRLVSAQSAQVSASQGMEKPMKSRACVESGADLVARPPTGVARRGAG